jgi:hypothetical protein
MLASIDTVTLLEGKVPTTLSKGLSEGRYNTMT